MSWESNHASCQRMLRAPLPGCFPRNTGSTQHILSRWPPSHRDSSTSVGSASVHTFRNLYFKRYKEVNIWSKAEFLQVLHGVAWGIQKLFLKYHTCLPTIILCADCECSVCFSRSLYGLQLTSAELTCVTYPSDWSRGFSSLATNLGLGLGYESRTH